MDTFTPKVIVHGGAGRRSDDPERLARYRAGLQAAADAGLAALTAGGTSVDAVEAAVRCMEAEGVFNAGRGATLTLDGQIECDAAIMDGRSGDSGACGGVPGVLHSVSLARKVMESTDHLLIVGQGGLALANEQGVELNEEGPLQERVTHYARLLRARRAEEAANQDKSNTRQSARLARLSQALGHGAEDIDEESDTVGAVAIDAQGRLAAAVSTGGLWLKLPGRVGDSAIVGAGLYAKDGVGAVSATGVGEAILRVSLSRRCCRYMREGLSAQQATERACEAIARKIGPNTAGLIAIDAQGRVGASMNTQAMGRAVAAPDQETWVAVAKEDGPPES